MDRTRRNELCERFDLAPTKKARAYSKGNRQKVALISVLASDVELLLLDEPTAKLEPLMEVAFQHNFAAGYVPYLFLLVALILAIIANLAAAALVVTLAVVLEYALVGSVLVGLATGLTVLAFAGVAAVTAQLSEFSRSATGMAGAVLGAALVLRALGEMIAVGGSALS